MTNFNIRTEYEVNCKGRKVTFAGFLIGPESPKKLDAHLKRLGLSAPTIAELFYLAKGGFNHLKKHPNDTNTILIKNAFSNDNGILSFTKVLATEEGIYAYDPIRYRRENMKEKRLIDSLERKAEGVSYSEDKTIRYLPKNGFFKGYDLGIANDNRLELVFGEPLLASGRILIPKLRWEEDAPRRDADIILPSQEYNYEILPCYAFVSLKITPHIVKIDGRNFGGGRGYVGDYTIGVIKRE